MLKRSAHMIKQGGVAVYPTDSGYALGCQIGDKAAIERIRRIRCLDKQHHFTLVCHDLSNIASYAKINNTVFRLLKANTPGPYTFILSATKEVPRRLLHPKRKTIGIRVPDHLILQALLAELGESILSVTLTLPEQESPLMEIEDIVDQLKGQVDVIIDSGHCEFSPTTVIDLTTGVAQIVREGQGDISAFTYS